MNVVINPVSSGPVSTNPTVPTVSPVKEIDVSPSLSTKNKKYMYITGGVIIVVFLVLTALMLYYFFIYKPTTDSTNIIINRDADKQQFMKILNESSGIKESYEETSPRTSNPEMSLKIKSPATDKLFEEIGKDLCGEPIIITEKDVYSNIDQFTTAVVYRISKSDLPIEKKKDYISSISLTTFPPSSRLKINKLDNNKHTVLTEKIKNKHQLKFFSKFLKVSEDKIPDELTISQYQDMMYNYISAFFDLSKVEEALREQAEFQKYNVDKEDYIKRQLQKHKDMLDGLEKNVDCDVILRKKDYVWLKK